MLPQVPACCHRKSFQGFRLALNIKRRVGVLLGKHKDWILWMASFMKKTDGTISTLPFAQTYSNLLSPTSQKLAVRPFSPERETYCVLSIWTLMHSYDLCPSNHQPYFPILHHCEINDPPDRLLRQSADNYFMLYLAESLTGRSYTEGKLLRYYPLWIERVKVANFVCCRQIPMGFGKVWIRMFSSCKG